MNLKFIEGGVCAAKGFKAAAMHVGIKTRNTGKKDIALIVADKPCSAASVYTRNIVKASPLKVTKAHLSDGKAQAVLVNSGNANACAPNGEAHALSCCEAAAKALGLKASDIIVSSTGVIGQELPVSLIIDALPELASKLSYDGSDDAATAIMTTDLTMKQCAVELEVGGKTVKIGGIAKGSGMIHPNMGTMLAFVTTDCAISSMMIEKALQRATNVSFNRVTVDGDTSTNDMLSLMANGLAGNPEITSECENYFKFAEALNSICIELAKMIASDGEGATHLITCTVSGAATEHDAEGLAKSVISSTLVKAAMFGNDANWGRILCALGYSGIEFDPEKVDVKLFSDAGEVAVCKSGRGLPFDEALAKKVLSERDVTIDINMNTANAAVSCWGCDISYDYIKINGDYRT